MDPPESIYLVEDLSDKPDILERPLEVSSSFSRGPTLLDPQSTAMGTSEITRHTPAGKPYSSNKPFRMVPTPPSAKVHRNSSADFPTPGFHAWNESEKTNALTTLHSLQAVIQAVIEDLDDRDNDEESLHASLSGYMEFVNYLVESRLPERAGSLQARAICLVVLAGVAIFLGVVQLVTLTLVAGLGGMPTGRNNSDTIGKVINFFAFCGVSFDALGAMFSLWTFRSLILTISKIEKIVFEKQNLNAKIHFTLDTFLKAASSSSPQKRQTIKTKAARVFGINQNIQPPSKNLVNLFADFQQSSTKYHREAREVVHIIDDHLPVQEDCIALAIIAAGLVFFFVSLFTFIIGAQPLSVWASTTVVVAVTFTILRINLSHQQPGSWRPIRLKVHTMITKYFPFKNGGASGLRSESDDDVLVIS